VIAGGRTRKLGAAQALNQRVKHCRRELWLSRLSTQAAEPQAIQSVQNGSIQVGTIWRTFVFYVPFSLREHAPLLIVFHGSGETGEEFRRRTEAAFDRLADANRFVVVYPDGHQRHWDDCRKVASYAARAQHIDDVGFVRKLIGYFEKALVSIRRASSPSDTPTAAK
jgi:poly(3-hydroxybutyrate) depolymerase